MSSPHAHSAKTRSSRQALKLDDITIVDRAILKRAVGAMAFGNAMEWFDFG
ncbi:proline/betaine transporter, partial [Burkholderia vietnamiensis]